MIIDQVAEIIDRETAAPEMLEALEAVVNELEAFEGYEPDWNENSIYALEMGQRAIAKAKGEE
jgi:hypothetical protein